MLTITADEAVDLIQPGHRVYVHEASMLPTSLVTALARRAPELRDVEVVHLHTNGPAPHVDESCEGHIRHNALFVGPNVRKAVHEGRADFTPVFLSEVPDMLEHGPLKVDVALIQVSPPDQHGFCRLGLSVACARAAVDHAAIVIAEINPRVPVTMGNTAVHVSRITAAVEVDRPLPSFEPEPFDDVARAIGRHTADLVPNGATLQMGIGRIPDAVLAALGQHEDLGVHTEMFSDGLLALVSKGVVTNRRKSRFEGRCITSFVMGSERVYEFVDQNPFVELYPSNIVNDPSEIRRQNRMTAINSAIEIDITGQVCADSVGERIHSGIGGQLDFVQGASRARHGRAIIALPSTAKGGTRSRIVPCLASGAGVVTTRGHVQWVVTEFGAVNLHGRCLRDRAALLAEVAHPDFRAELLAAAKERFGCKRS